MKKVVIVFGLISGVISSAMMFLTLPFMKSGAINSKNGEIIGYTAIFLSFLISCVFYVGSWEIIYFKFMPDFGDKYAARTIETMREKGATEAAIAAKTKEMETFKKMYRNPLFNAAMTFMEPFPVGLIMTLLSAAILRRRTPTPAPGVAQAF